jgi:23S rRNA pseudouridine1911/1915/1917 synthase
LVVELTARAEHQGLRADRVVAELAAEAIEGSSRAAVQRWMKEGRVSTAGSVGGRQPVDAKHKIVAGQVFSVDVPLPPASAAVAEDGVEFTVIYVDDDVVVVDKPAGLVVHPAHGHASGTLVNGLLGRGLFARELLEEGGAEEHDRPGIVHRIDKDTSGLLVVARNAMAREHLKAQFAAHTIERVYAALALGDLQSGTFSTLHGRHPKDRVKFSSRVTDGKRAVTHVERVRGFGVATHVECRLETGRTHQIRVHLADHGHPLLGDTLYGARPKDERARRAAEAMGRQALHAGALGFEHPRSGECLRFSSELPAEFRAALAILAG